MRNVLIYFSLKYGGDYKKVFDAIYNKERVEEEGLAQTKNVHNALTCLDDNYPNQFKTTISPPLVTFYKGDISLLNSHEILGIMGSQNPSNYGIESTTKILKETFKNKELTLITTLDVGLNSEAVNLALTYHQKIIIVLPSGIDNYFPSSNYLLFERVLDEGGLIISEYPYKEKVQSQNYSFRLRYIAALAKVILITEGDNEGQINSLVQLALEGNARIATIPTPVMTLSYNNSLLKDGASPIYDEEMLLEYLF